MTTLVSVAARHDWHRCFDGGERVPSAFRFGFAVRGFLLFLLFVGLGTLTVYMVFAARDFEVERIALQKRAENLLRRQQQLQSERRILAEQPLLRERTIRELGLVEIDMRRRQIAVLPEKLRQKYMGASTPVQVAVTAPERRFNLESWQNVLDQLVAVTKVQAAQEIPDKN